MFMSLSIRGRPFTFRLRPLAQLLLVWLVCVAPPFFAPAAQSAAQSPTKKIGVLHVVHGAGRSQHFSHFFDAGIQIASYNPNSSTYRNTIWQPENWPRVVPLADRERVASLLGLYRKSTFEFGRLGNLQPAAQITEAQTHSLREALTPLGRSANMEFVVDWVSWITGSDDIDHLPYPRFIYNRGGQSEVAMRYCGGPGDGGAPPDGQWPQCDPERYNVDGPMDRLLRAGVESIVLIDTTVGSVRFSKTYDVQNMLRKARDDALGDAGDSIPIFWVNDPTGLIEASYPTEPANWTASLGPPRVDAKVPLENRGNPVTDDPQYAAIYATGIIRAMSGSVSPAETGVLLFNHGIYPGNEVFDPKISDTVRLNQNLQDALLSRFPEMSAANVVGGWEGIKEQTGGQLERTRAMRGEDLGHAFLYESPGEMPPGKWGLRYWDALERLKANGVKHIVVAFPQVNHTTTVGQVGLPNQIAKEIGHRGFRPVADLPVPLWPGFDSPFADYWPPNVQLLCRSAASDNASDNATSHDCCYRLGGCYGDVPYPETRQTPLDKPMSRVDPAIVFDVPAFGHLGYDPAAGQPDNDVPVQDQYTGTWSIWVPLDDDPTLAGFLARTVMSFLNDRAAE